MDLEQFTKLQMSNENSLIERRILFMLEKLSDSLKNLLGIQQGSNVEVFLNKSVDVADAVSPFVPAVSSIINYYKFYRMGKRIDELDKKIVRMELKINELSDKDYNFLRQKAFPVMLENLFDEQQEEKVQLILNGFESIIENHITDEDKVFTFYDVLEGLRAHEIKRLMQHTKEYREMLIKNPEKLKLNFDISPEGNNNRAFLQYIDNKLESLGLIELTVYDHGDFDPSRGPITTFGENFIDFLKVKI